MYTPNTDILGRVFSKKTQRRKRRREVWKVLFLKRCQSCISQWQALCFFTMPSSALQLFQQQFNNKVTMGRCSQFTPSPNDCSLTFRTGNTWRSDRRYFLNSSVECLPSGPFSEIKRREKGYLWFYFNSRHSVLGADYVLCAEMLYSILDWFEELLFLLQKTKWKWKWH